MSKRREKAKPQNTLNQQLEAIQDANRPKEKDDNLIQLGKFFYSLAGLTYAGALLEYVVHIEEGRTEELLSGLAMFLVMSVTGWILVKRGNIKK